jgi:hypothetical protein
VASAVTGLGEAGKLGEFFFFFFLHKLGEFDVCLGRFWGVLGLHVWGLVLGVRGSTYLHSHALRLAAASSSSSFRLQHQLALAPRAEWSLWVRGCVVCWGLLLLCCCPGTGYIQRLWAAGGAQLISCRCWMGDGTRGAGAGNCSRTHVKTTFWGVKLVTCSFFFILGGWCRCC